MLQKPSTTSLLTVKHAPNFENFYLTIGDILQIPLILTHAPVILLPAHPALFAHKFLFQRVPVSPGMQ